MIFNKVNKPNNLKVLVKEASIEVRFSSKEDASFVQGLMLPVLKKCGYDNPEKNDMLNISDDSKNKIGDLKYFPSHKFTKGNFILLVGSDVVCLSVRNYDGWNEFYKEWKLLYKEIGQFVDIINSILVRYINISNDYNLLKKLNMFEFMSNISSQEENAYNVMLEYKEENYNVILKLLNAVSLNEDLVGSDKGTVIDIGTICRNVNSVEIVDKMHEEIENCYFGMMSKISKE